SALRRRGHLPFLLAQMVVWTVLLSATGGVRSPLLFGYFLEVVLAGLLAGRTGLLFSGAGAIAGLAALSAVHHTIWDPATAAALGFVLVVTLLGDWLARMLARRDQEAAAVHRALQVRAMHLVEELRLLGDYLDVALLTIDSMGRVEAMNRFAAAMLGRNLARMVGKPWQDVLRCDQEGAMLVTGALAGTSAPARRVTIEVNGRSLPVELQAWLGPSERGLRTFLLLSPDPAPSRTSEDPLRRLGEAAACVSHQIRNSIHAL